MFAGKIADRALLYSDFEFLGVNRKKGGKEERKTDRGGRQRRNVWVNKRKAKGRDISMERSDEERRRKVEPY